MTQNDTHREHYEKQVPDDNGGQRLDQILALLFPEFSRSRLQQWNKSGKVLVNNEVLKGKHKLMGGETISLTVQLEEETEAIAQDLPIDVVYEDASIIVINKSADMVMHPAAGNPDGTLLNALLHHYPDLREVPRAGIVHRLDKETSGLLVVARTLAAHNTLVAQLQARTVKREYLALACGEFISGGTIKQPISRHPKDRKKMSVFSGGKEAITHYEIAEPYRGHTLAKVRLETGRTHQIRVHFAHIRCPLIGDPVYGRRLQLPHMACESLVNQLRGFKRQALHARKLGLIHPDTEDHVEWQAPVPEDFAELINAFRDDLEQHGYERPNTNY